MPGFKFASLLMLALASPMLLCSPADAATVRRHLHCTTLGGGITIQFLTTTTFPGLASITNNWSTAIPAGTAYTLTVDRRSISFTSNQTLEPGASMAAGHPNITGPGQACDVSFIDTGFQTGGGNTPPKKTILNNFAGKTQGMFSAN